jgi:hypothetical protein
MKDKLFKGFSEFHCWIPLTIDLMEAHNMGMQMSKGDDLKYCKVIALFHDLYVPLYVDAGGVDISTYNRFFHVFVYVVEIIYGQKINKVGEYIRPIDLFNDIKKHWNDDIDKEIRRIKNGK